jgi:hypothetical protein
MFIGELIIALGLCAGTIGAIIYFSGDKEE